MPREIPEVDPNDEVDAEPIAPEKTQKEIIDETLKYFEENPFGWSKEEGSCYLTEDGLPCAVGRCMLDPGKAEEENKNTVIDFLPADLEVRLKPEYRGHGRHFWAALQHWHDTMCWLDMGDSADKERADEITTELIDWFGSEDSDDGPTDEKAQDETQQPTTGDSE